MGSCDQQANDWSTVLRRQPTRVVEGRPEGYTDMFELICGDCGDDPELDYREVSPRLKLVRGPYPIAIGVVAYEQHIASHQRLQGAAGSVSHVTQEPQRAPAADRLLRQA